MYSQHELRPSSPPPPSPPPAKTRCTAGGKDVPFEDAGRQLERVSTPVFSFLFHYFFPQPQHPSTVQLQGPVPVQLHLSLRHTKTTTKRGVEGRVKPCMPYRPFTDRGVLFCCPHRCGCRGRARRAPSFVCQTFLKKLFPRRILLTQP